jgi:hypothetical protein
MIVPNLCDARALLDRARRHFREFQEFTGNGAAVWQWKAEHDPESGEWVESLGINRKMLVAAKPILADSANNVVSALDHVAAAIAKANGHERVRTLYFPLGLTDEAFEKASAKTEPFLGKDMLTVIAEIRARHPVDIHSIDAAKQISNSGKHWELMTATGAAKAVIVPIPGDHRTFEVPADAFDKADVFEFYRGPDQLPSVGRGMVLNLLVRGLDEGSQGAANSILEGSLRFAEQVIAAVAKAAST